MNKYYIIGDRVFLSGDKGIRVLTPNKNIDIPELIDKHLVSKKTASIAVNKAYKNIHETWEYRGDRYISDRNFKNVGEALDYLRNDKYATKEGSLIYSNGRAFRCRTGNDYSKSLYDESTKRYIAAKNCAPVIRWRIIE